METIKSNEEISRIFSKGRRLTCKYATFIVVKKGEASSRSNISSEHDPSGRVAFIAGKKLGNAVWRNSAKRRMREIYRAESHTLQDFDLLFVARKPILDASYSKVLTTCEQTLKRITHEQG